MPPVTVFFDLETAGLEPQHPTIQLAAVAIGPLGQELGAFEQKIAFNPTDADPAALALNGYTAEALREAVAPGVAASRFAAWLRPYCTIDRVSKASNPYAVARGAGYNVTTFDGPRLRALFGAAFCPVDYLLLDVLQRVLWYCRDVGEAPENFKLSTVAAWFGLSTDGAHDALADARMAAAVVAELSARTEVW